MTAYTCVWEFRVKPGREKEFESQYGPEGAWARLFRRSSGYIETMLLKATRDSLRYVTIDRWTSEEHYRAFRTEFSGQYSELDRRCEALTTDEVLLGEFSEQVASES